MWAVRVYIGNSICGGLRDARAHLNPRGAGLLWGAFTGLKVPLRFAVED